MRRSSRSAAARGARRETGAITDAAAAELLALGVVPGDRLGDALPTGPEHLFLWLATAKAGIVSCPLHVDLAPPEVEAAVAHLPRAALSIPRERSRSGAPKRVGSPT